MGEENPIAEAIRRFLEREGVEGLCRLADELRKEGRVQDPFLERICACSPAVPEGAEFDGMTMDDLLEKVFRIDEWIDREVARAEQGCFLKEIKRRRKAEGLGQ